MDSHVERLERLEIEIGCVGKEDEVADMMNRTRKIENWINQLYIKHPDLAELEKLKKMDPQVDRAVLFEINRNVENLGNNFERLRLMNHEEIIQQELLDMSKIQQLERSILETAATRKELRQEIADLICLYASWIEALRMDISEKK